jgi:hypothetical protein
MAIDSFKPSKEKLEVLVGIDLVPTDSCHGVTICGVMQST